MNGDPRLIGKRRQAGASSPKLVIALAVLTVMAGITVGISTTLLMKNAGHERTWTRLATEVQVGSQKLSKAAAEAALGNIEAISELETTYQQLDRNMQALRIGSPAGNLPPTPEEVGTEMRALNTTWTRVSDNAYEIINAERLVNELSTAGSAVYNAIPQIQANTDQMVRQLVESGAPSQQVFAGSRQLVLADRIQRRVNEILRNGANAAAAAEDLQNEMAVFAQVQQALVSGNQRMGITPVRNQQALASLSNVRRGFAAAQPSLQSILDAAERLRAIRVAADNIFLDSEAVFRQAGDLSRAVAALPRTRAWPSTQINTIALVALIVLAIALVGFVLLSATRKADTAHKSNRRTQEAIIRLLDELGALAEGDLTTRATVTDEITGAIADAVNFAIERLRELVVGINQTAAEVARSAESTRTSTSRLAESANEQAGQVGRATEKIQAMSTAFNTMAQRSLSSSETALDSVTMAHAGAGKVRKTIQGMDTIRDQIQETSKRIKRLGESTQEIGDIVGLIKDIAEQTNVLALNAAIQAASAGGSGQGFGVVADEVQQLAESATNATRRITSLVQTIQADTAEAVRSMEETTSEVVNGARLAQDAGASLSQIELASTELSALIEDIAREAEAHSGQAQRISELMDGIREVSVKTSKGTSLTADAVAELAERVMQLQASVSDFKLPEQPESAEALPVPALPEPAPEPEPEPEPELLSEPGAQAETTPEETQAPGTVNDELDEGDEGDKGDEDIPPSLVPPRKDHDPEAPARAATGPDAVPEIEAPDWETVEYSDDADTAEDNAEASNGDATSTRRESA